jgi:hypothetical protein
MDIAELRHCIIARAGLSITGELNVYGVEKDCKCLRSSQSGDVCSSTMGYVCSFGRHTAIISGPMILCSVVHMTVVRPGC